MTYQQISWTITVVLVVAVVSIGAASLALDLGAVMHDLHCPEHGALASAKSTGV